MAKLNPEKWWIRDIEFWSPRFAQFSLEIVITAMYFVVGLTLDLPVRSSPPPPAPPAPSESWVIGTVVAIWLAYVVWDLLDICISPSSAGNKWHSTAKVGCKVSVGFLLLYGLLFGIEMEVFPAGNRNHTILGWNLGVLALLYLYRVIQQLAREKCA